MNKNNNNGIINQLAHDISKFDKTRNIFVILAITLATMMIFATFTVGASFAANYSTYTKRAGGTCANIFLSHPAKSQIKQMENTSGIKYVGQSINGGRVMTASEKSKNWIPVSWRNSTQWKNFDMPAFGKMTGVYPSEANEIMLSAGALKALGIKSPKQGMKLDLNMKTAVGTEKKVMILSGWVRTYEEGEEEGSRLAFVSKDYYAHYGMTVRNSGIAATSAGIFSAEKIKDNLKKSVTLRSGQSIDLPYKSAEDGTKSVALIALAIAAAVAFMIVLGGYLLIYNIMYISVNRDIRLYGMLKTIGTTPKQIRKLVRKQIYKLAFIGVPIGVGAGILFSLLMVPWIMKSIQNDTSGVYSIMSTDVSFSAPIFIGTVLFILLTIIMAGRKPAKVAAKISPVEAAHYTGVEIKTGRKERARRVKSLFQMAKGNVFSEKRKAILVFLSLFIGVMTMLLCNGFVDSLSVDNYIKTYSPHDFRLTTAEDNYHFSDSIVKKIKNTEGIGHIYVTNQGYSRAVFDLKTFEPILRNQYEASGSEEKYSEFVKQNAGSKNFGAEIFTLNSQYIKTAEKAGLDIGSFRDGKEVMISNHGDLSSMIGKTIILTGKNGTKKIKVKIGAVTSYGSIKVAAKSTMMNEPEAIFVSSKLMKELDPGSGASYIDIDAQHGKEPLLRANMTKYKTALSAADAAFTYESRADELQSFTRSMQVLSVMGNSIAVLLMIIGLLNFVNLIVTGIYNRRQQFAVLESIGMTGRQIEKMVRYEGLIYAIVTFILCMSIGNVLMYAMSKAVTALADYAIFSYPVLLTLIVFSAILAICVLMPAAVYKRTSGESVTERLREASY